MVRYSTAAVSEKGDRDSNQDAYRIEWMNEGGNLVLADGVGGESGGKEAAEIAVERLSQIPCSGKLPDREEVLHYYQLAAEDIYARSQNQQGMKTTLVQLSIWKNHAIWSHMGDSRLYHLFDGQIADMTLDHSIAQMAVYFGEITREEIKTFPSRNVLTRALGNPESHASVENAKELAPGKHLFFLCTDGFWERMDETKLICHMDEESAEDFLQKVVRDLQESPGGEMDNYTALALMLWVEEE